MKKTLFLLIILVCMSFNSCTFYSLSGASIPVGTKTISIDYIKNRAASVQPTVSQVFSDELTNYFLNQSNLRLVEINGDIEISGEIVDYAVAPSAIQGDDKAALNRLTIRVQIRLTNHIDEKMSFTQSFSRFRDFNASQNLMQVESELILSISKELVEDIYNKAFVNW